jgi:hypothetical protein
MKLHQIGFRLSALAVLLTADLVNGKTYLFISSPSTSSIYASRLLTTSEQARNAPMTAEKLPGSETIKEPKGLAVDSTRKIIFVVDGSSARTLHAGRLYLDHIGTIRMEGTTKIAESLSSDWVAVDYTGKVFFIANNQLWSMAQSVVSDRLDGGDGTGNSTKPSKPSYVPIEAKTGEPTIFKLLYDGGNVPGVNMPQGLAVDGYRLFWSNGQNGQQDGTVVQGLQDPLGNTKVTSLATNLPLAHGVCVTTTRLFYSDEENKVFTTKLNGGPFAMITEKLKKPRGCAFDGDGTVFVADWGDNKIVSFAGAAMNLGPRRISLALSGITDPFGLAVLQGDRNAGVMQSGALRTTAAMSAGIAVASLLSLHA